jgi:hypothetical protein
MSSPTASIINEQIAQYKKLMKFIKEEYENSINCIENDDEDFEFYKNNYDQWKQHSFTDYSINCHKHSKYKSVLN